MNEVTEQRWLHGLRADSHPLRASLSDVMRVRKLPSFREPARLLQVVRIIDPRDVQAGVAWLRSHLAASESEIPDDSRFYACRLGELGLGWEQHSEFMTCTLVASSGGTRLFDPSPFSAAGALLASAPGKVIRATLIDVLQWPGTGPTSEELASYFSPDDLVVTDVAEGRARVWTDFRLHEDGFGRLLLVDRGLIGREHEPLVQRLQEIGNYRKMALLGLPLAHDLIAELTALEKELASLVSAIARPEQDDVSTLDALTSLSTRIAHLTERTRFRLDATQAYSEICLDRIKRVSATPVAGFRSLSDFTERRLIPAMRSCAAFGRRLDSLAQRASWASDLMRTRVDTRLSRLNCDLLSSMDYRAHLQLRLQQAVEGLSFVAITYYLMGIADHVREVLVGYGWRVASSPLLGLVVPLVLGGAYVCALLLRRSERPRANDGLNPDGQAALPWMNTLTEPSADL